MVIGGMLLSVFLLCCSGVAVIGAFTDDSPQDRRAVADDQNAPSAAPPVVVPSTSEPASPVAVAPSPTSAAPSPTRRAQKHPRSAG